MSGILRKEENYYKGAKTIMLRSVLGVYDGSKLELKETVEVKGKTNVRVTFLNEVAIPEQQKFYLKRLLDRKPIKITPLKVKDLIEEGRR